MKKLLLLLLFPLLMFSQETILVGDVDCSGTITSEDASLILQFVTSVIDELPCEENMIGLTPDQLQDMINMMSEQINVDSEQPISMIGPMYLPADFEFTTHYSVVANNPDIHAMYYFDAVRFCAQLEYNGFDDWVLPSFHQIHNYFTNNYLEGIVIPNNSNGEKIFWLSVIKGFSSITGSDTKSISVSINGPDATLPNQLTRMEDSYISSGGPSCFCVR